jgi:hypothetical protein
VTDVKKMQFLTTSAWLRGYAETLDEDRYRSLIHKMNQAADLLCEVWDEYEAKLEAEKGEWDGLTKEEVDSWELPDCPTVFEFVQFIEAKVKEKNT